MSPSPSLAPSSAMPPVTSVLQPAVRVRAVTAAPVQWLACAALPRVGVAAAGMGLLWALAAWAMHGGQ